MRKELIDNMTFEELVDDMAGYVLQALLRGEFRSGMFAAMGAAVSWHEIQERQKLNKSKLGG